MYETQPSVGRKMEYPERITLPLADGTKARIDALLVEGEARLDLIREGIEREIKRRGPKRSPKEPSK